MSTPHEVLDTNYDYYYAAEQRRNPQKGLVQIMGERALRWVKGMNQKRKEEKADRKYKGSLDEIHAVMQDTERQQTMQPRPVLAEPGLYRSNFSGEQPDITISAEENDDLMRAAAERARKALGVLPVITMHEPEQPQANAIPPEDAALIARLERAYAQDAKEPDRSGHTTNHGAEADDDRLVSTSGK